MVFTDTGFQIFHRIMASPDISIAPSSRAGCKAAGKFPHKIEQGSIRISTHYMKDNHDFASHRCISCASKAQMVKFLCLCGDKIENMKGFESLPEPAKIVASRIVDAILNDAPISFEDRAFKIVVDKPKKTIAKKKKEEVVA